MAIMWKSITTKKLIISAALLIIAVAFGVVAVGEYRQRTTTEEPTLRVGEFPGTISAALELAEQRQYFVQEKVKVQFIETDTRNVIEKIQRGDLDIGYNGVGADLMNANIRGANLKIIADLAQAESTVLVRKDLWDSGAIRSVKDLRGKNVRAAKEGSGSYYSLALHLQEAGLDINKDITLRSVSPSDVIAAFEGKTIDAAELSAEPYLTYALEKNVAVILPLPAELFQLPVLVASSQVLRERSREVKAFLRAYQRAVTDYSQAYRGVEPYRQEVVKVIADVSGVPTEVAEKMHLHYVDPKGRPNLKRIQDMIDFFFANKNIDRRIGIDELVDLSYLP